MHAKHRVILILLCLGTAVAGLAWGAPRQHKPKVSNVLKLDGYFAIRRPAQTIDMETLRRASGTGTIPAWTFDVLSSRDSNEYRGAMVGRDPFNDPGSVSIPTTVIPLIITTNTVATNLDVRTGTISTQSGVTTFNPDQAYDGCLAAPNDTPATLFGQSPIFQPRTFEFGGTLVGSTQYADAFQRGNFWNALGSNVTKYHVLLGPVTFVRPVVEDVPAIDGTSIPTQLSHACGPLGIVDINWLDNLLTGSVIPGLAAEGVNPTTFPIFMLYNVVGASPVENLNTCCVLGYHGAMGTSLPLQTFAVADFDSTKRFVNASGDSGPFSDTAVASHEVAEWMDDPFVNNEVAPWGNVEGVAGCDNSFEVGDPLTGTAYGPALMPNGFTYHLQELAFFSWFLGAPSIAVNGWFFG